MNAMASKIEQYLNKILSSRFGKDVRQSIHDGIKQCYSDVTNPDLNVDAFETAVQNKIDSGALAAMTIADGSITKEKLDPDLVDPSLTIDGSVADSGATGKRLQNIEKLFGNMISPPYRLNRGILSSDGKIYYKAENEENYTSYNLFLFDVSDFLNISMSIESSNNIFLDYLSYLRI